MLVTNNKEYADRARLLRSHGMTSLSYHRARGHATDYDVIELGFNYRMDDIRASIGLVQLDKLYSDLTAREMKRKRYIELLKGVKGLVIPFEEAMEFSSNYVFTIILDDSTYEKRDHVRETLAVAGIQTSVHYPAVHRFSIYKDYTVGLPVTEYVTDNLITLPMYSRLTDDEIVYITDRLKAILND